MLSRAYITFQVLGNVWYYKCDNCLENAPELSILTLIYIILGYLFLSLPCCLFTMICLCLPFLITVFLWIVRGANKEGQIRTLPPEVYSSAQHTQSRNCTICHVPFVDGVRIIPFPCNSRHVFHEECAKSWINCGYEFCPTCKQNLTQSDTE